MRFVVLGAGAMGCLYGAKLKKAGQEVVMIDSMPATVEAISENGIRFVTNEGEEALDIPAFYSADYHEEADVLIVFTKGIHSAQALSSLSGVIGADTILVSFQNGLGHDKVMGAFADADHIVIGTTNFPSDRLDFGKIASRGTGVTRMMTASGQETDKLKELYDVFAVAGLNPEIAPEIFGAIWEKVAFNAALNSLTGVLLMPQGYMGETSEGKELCHAIVDETCSVAEKKGIKVCAEHVHQNVDQLLKEHFGHCPSMLQDVLAERITEVEFINGAVVHEAEALGMEVPVTKVLYYLMSIVQKNYPNRLVTKK